MSSEQKWWLPLQVLTESTTVSYERLSVQQSCWLVHSLVLLSPCRKTTSLEWTTHSASWRNTGKTCWGRKRRDHRCGDQSCLATASSLKKLIGWWWGHLFFSASCVKLGLTFCVLSVVSKKRANSQFGEKLGTVSVHFLTGRKRHTAQVWIHCEESRRNIVPCWWGAQLC